MHTPDLDHTIHLHKWCIHLSAISVQRRTIETFYPASCDKGERWMECSARHRGKVASASTPYEDSGATALAPLFLLRGSHTVSCAGSALTSSWYPEGVLNLLGAIRVVCIKVVYSRCLV